MRETLVVTGKRLTIGAILVSAGAVLHAAPAAADQTDDAFVAKLQQHGIIISNRDTAITMGHNVCTGLDKGETPTFVAMSLIKATDLSAKESGYFLGAAVTYFCPQHKAALDNS